MVELADTADLKSVAERHEGSNPSIPTGRPSSMAEQRPHKALVEGPNPSAGTDRDKSVMRLAK